MSIQIAYRRMPEYLATPLALLVSAVLALTLAALGATTLDFLLGKFQRSDDLDNAITAFFFAAPSIAVLAFVFCFSILSNWHHATSWRAPTFAFALGSSLLWLWTHDWIGFAWYVPGTFAWLVSCWLCHRRSISHSEHVLQA
jgi:ABC-type proline/glycine betaine transport system permease subunit